MKKKNSFLVLILLITFAAFGGAGCVTKKETPKTQTTPTATSVITPKVAKSEEVFNENASDSEILKEANGQWATDVKASSTYADATGNNSWSAKQATGQPNVNVYEDNSSAWAPKEKNKGEEYLELTFANPVYAYGVRVKESFGSGAITKIELKDAKGEYQNVWEGVDTTRGLNYLQVQFDKTDYKTNVVKITLDTTKSPDDWTEIDAVQLVGTK